MKASHRERGTIRKTFVGKEDHGIPTVWIYLDFDGSSQGFGGLGLEAPTQNAYVREVLKTFGAKTLKDLEGQECWALRSFSSWNRPIEGLETLKGKRFTHTGFRKRHYPEGASSPLHERIEDLELDIAFHTRRIAENRRELAKLEADFVDWESGGE